jgi:hypothetical protein
MEREEKHNLHAIIIDRESLCLRLNDGLQVGKHLKEKVKELKTYGLWFSPMSRLTKNEAVSSSYCREVAHTFFAGLLPTLQ